MEYTGRYLVLNRTAGDHSLPKMLRDQAGLRIASASDFPRGTVDSSSLSGADGVYFDRLGVAVTSTAPDQRESLTKGVGSRMLVERERLVYAVNINDRRGPLHPASPTRDYAPMDLPAGKAQSLGTAAARNLIASLTAAGPVAARKFGTTASAFDESVHTWGLAATRVIESLRTGRGVRIAVLDTGFDIDHPDFAGRGVVAKSFVDGETAQDANQHGTHCIGTAAGPANPATKPRYGVATGADIYAGKVLSDSGRGNDGGVMSGINWALASACRVISMSLGTGAQVGDSYSEVYEEVAQRALAQNTLIIAAAGNESDRRNNRINPVGHPANCPSIMAVGAIDCEMRIGHFSCGGLNPDGGKVDIVGPGVDVHSSVPPGSHGKLTGTSMACPHISGLAALYMEAFPNASAKEIWQMLTENAKRLPLEVSDMGAGLGQAPR